MSCDGTARLTDYVTLAENHPRPQFGRVGAHPQVPKADGLPDLATDGHCRRRRTSDAMSRPVGGSFSRPAGWASLVLVYDRED